MTAFDAGSLLRSCGVTDAHHIVFVTGAGVSVEHPTHAPSGPDLMRQAMAFFLDGVDIELENAYRAFAEVAGIDERTYLAGRPRLEAVLDVIASAHGEEALASLTVNFVGRPVNRVHALLASHLAAGGRQVTANFDRFVEHAVSTAAFEAPHHFHGEVETVADTLPFGALLGRIEHGFTLEARENMLAALVAPDTAAVAWFGYSFSDYFDATPAVVQAIDDGRLEGKTILWMDWAPTDISVTELEDPAKTAPEVIRTARRRGIRVLRIAGPTGDALFALLEAIGCELDPSWATAAACPGADRLAPPKIESDAAARRAATIRLLSRFGIVGRLARPDCAIDLPIEGLPGDVRAELLWKQGDYRRAHLAAGEALTHAPRGVETDVRRDLLAARFDWIRGRFLSAGRRTIRALRTLDALAEPPRSLQAEALERFGRVAVAMRRNPDTRLLLLPWFSRAVADYESRVAALERHRAQIGGVQISHTADALHNFEREVRGRDAADTRGAAEVRSATVQRFSESESLDSFVDYVRGNANIGEWPFAVAAGETWQTGMAALYAAVGNDADVHRMTLLSRPATDAPLRSVLDAAMQLDVTWWHRLRMVVYCLLNRMLRT